jgi:hypothetical protein
MFRRDRLRICCAAVSYGKMTAATCQSSCRVDWGANLVGAKSPQSSAARQHPSSTRTLGLTNRPIEASERWCRTVTSSKALARFLTQM